MKKVTLYSSSRSSMTGRPIPTTQPDQFKSPEPPRESSPTQVASQEVRFSWQNFCARHKRLLWVAAGGLFGLLLVLEHAAITPSPRQIGAARAERIPMAWTDSRLTKRASVWASEISIATRSLQTRSAIVREKRISRPDP